MTRWGEIKCPKCAAPPISLWEGMERSLEESDAREARLEAKLAKLRTFLDELWDSQGYDARELHDLLKELDGVSDE